MKARILISVIVGLLVLFLIGCSAPRKLAGAAKETQQVEEKRAEANRSEESLSVDTTKRTGVEVTYTKVEYYPPGPNDNSQYEEEPTKEPEGMKQDNKKPLSNDSKKPPNKNGPVKSIEQYTYKQTAEEAGVTKQDNKTEGTFDEEVNANKTAEEETTEEPAADPYRWRYILGILIVGAIIFVLIAKSKVFAILRSFFRKLF